MFNLILDLISHYLEVKLKGIDENIVVLFITESEEKEIKEAQRIYNIYKKKVNEELKDNIKIYVDEVEV